MLGSSQLQRATQPIKTMSATQQIKPELIDTISGITVTFEIYKVGNEFAAKKKGFKARFFKEKKHAVKFAIMQSGKPGK